MNTNWHPGKQGKRRHSKGENNVNLDKAKDWIKKTVLP